MSERIHETPELPFAQRDIQEKETQRERRDRLTGMVRELFAGEENVALREKIEASFDVPQIGDHHNEGVLMDTHLELILKTIDDVAAKKFHPHVGDEVQATLLSVVKQHPESLKRYIFLHDIAKMDKMTVTYAGKKPHDMTWEAWETLLEKKQIEKKDPAAIRAGANSEALEKIGYPKHGDAGVEAIESMGGQFEDRDVILSTIAKHEVAFQFSQINVGTYKKHLADLSPEQRDWAMTASYIDTMGSLTKTGYPDLFAFVIMTDSRHNYELIQSVRPVLEGDATLDPKKVAQTLQRLEKTTVRLSESMQQLVGTLRKECVVSRYDRKALAAQLRVLVDTEEISPEVLQEVLDAVHDDGRINETRLGAVRKNLGSKNQLVTAALQTAEIKG